MVSGIKNVLMEFLLGSHSRIWNQQFPLEG